MNKDVIYIDVDDDVTAIIGKIKKAKEKIVALVPPKRTGALQSAVNLRLLDRMAKNEKKKLVLITSNQALVALAASAQIPVAKNLQSKPEIAEVPALIIDDGDDIIDGADLPIGDHAKTVKVKDGTRPSSGSTRSDAVDTTNLDIDESDVVVGATPVAGVMAKQAVKKGKNGPKIPNFDTFRKKLLLIIAGGAALVALIVWMFVFAPAATVIITASTEPVPVSSTIQLGGSKATNYAEGVVSSVTEQQEVEETLEFEATGEKDLGNKAAGSMELTRTSVSSNSLTIPAGTRFTSGSIVFESTESATLGGTTVGPGGFVQDSATVAVVAAEPGPEYNVSARSYQASMGGFSSQGSAMSGGTTKLAKVVSAEDVERARGELMGRSTDEQKKALIESFTNGEIAISSSFTVERGEITSSPAVNAEAEDGKGTLTIPTMYTMHAVPKADLNTYLQQYLESQLTSEETQKVYSTGVDNATVSNFARGEDSLMATVNSIGRVGPEINEDVVKESIKGQRYGDVQQSLEARGGIKEVDVQFSYFWVRTVPNDINKITIEFKVEDGQ